jgi:hypothetical protein
MANLSGVVGHSQMAPGDDPAGKRVDQGVHPSLLNAPLWRE